MEPNNIYKSIIVLLNNAFKDEKLRTKMILDSQFKETILKNILNLLALEKDFDSKYNEKTWFAPFAKAYVNVISEKVKFEKPESQKPEDIYGEYSYALTYASNTFEVDRSVLTDESLSISEEEIKLNQKVSNDMLEKYGDKKASDPKVEVVDKNNEKPNTNQTNNNGAAFAGMGGFGGGQPGMGGMNNPFMQNSGLIHPLQDDRFYPFVTKPKFMPWVRIANAVIVAITAILFLILEIIKITKGTVDFMHSDKLATNDASRPQIDMGFIADGHPLKVGISSPSMGGGWLGLMIPILFVMALVYMSYTMLKKPRFFRDQYKIPNSVLFIFAIFSLIAVTQELWSSPDILSTNGLQNTIEKWFSIKGNLMIDGDYVKTHDLDWLMTIDGNNVTFTKGGLPILEKAMSDYLMENTAYMAIKVITIIFIVFGILQIGLLVATFFLNPRMDRQKLGYANNEFNKKMAAMMQGQEYEMDKSMYVDEAEYAEFVKKRDSSKQPEKTDE